MRAIFFDTETTGLKSDKDRIIEIAAYDPTLQKEFVSFVNPGIAIPQESIAICGITDEMVQDAPSFKEVGESFVSFCSGDVYLVAHNGDAFDKPFLEAEFKRAGLQLPPFRFVDTLKWSKKYRPDLPRHALQHLREVYGIAANTAHRALDDVKVLERVFSCMTDDLPINLIFELCQGSTAVAQMPFGKYRGRPLKDIPASYISWLTDNGALDKPENADLKNEFVKLGMLKCG